MAFGAGGGAQPQGKSTAPLAVRPAPTEWSCGQKRKARAVIEPCIAICSSTRRFRWYPRRTRTPSLLVRSWTINCSGQFAEVRLPHKIVGFLNFTCVAVRPRSLALGYPSGYALVLAAAPANSERDSSPSNICDSYAWWGEDWCIAAERRIEGRRSPDLPHKLVSASPVTVRAIAVACAGVCRNRSNAPDRDEQSRSLPRMLRIARDHIESVARPLPIGQPETQTGYLCLPRDPATFPLPGLRSRRRAPSVCSSRGPASPSGHVRFG